MRRLSHNIHRGLRVLVLSLALMAGAALAQTADEHAAHHPGGSTPKPSTPSPASTTMPTGGNPKPKPEGMGNMMDGMMGGKGEKPLYPSLMDVPKMTPEKRREVERKAHERMRQSLARISSATARLADASSRNDDATMQEATADLRAATAQFESGVAVSRALKEGHEPQRVALQWFKREMNLLPPMDAETVHNELGLPSRWFHYLTIAFLGSIVIAMIGMYFLKMRRASALFGRIEADKGTPPPGSAPELAGGKPSSGDKPPDDEPPSDEEPPPVDKPPSDDKPPSASQPDAPADKPAAAPSGASEVESSPPLTANWRGQLRVGSIVTETPSVKTFRLVNSSNERLPFTFVPGQFLNLAFWIGGARMNRSYSISSSPTQREYVELTVRREPRGAVSRHIDDLLKVGDEIEMGGPVGKFTFNGTEAESIVLISGGVGITPMVSITRYLTERSWPGDIFFIYTCRTSTDFIFANEIAALERRNPKLHVAVTLTKAEGTNWKGARGRITKEWLMQTVPNLGSRRIHICGPPAMMDATKALLTEIGVPSEQVKTEAFGTPKPSPSAAGTTAKPSTPATGPLVTFSTNHKSAKIHEGQTVLELSEELGIAIEFSCRVGTCGVCKTKMTSGNVDQEVQDALDDEDQANGIILACQAKPTEAITVEA